MSREVSTTCGDGATQRLVGPPTTHPMDCEVDLLPLVGYLDNLSVLIYLSWRLSRDRRRRIKLKTLEGGGEGEVEGKVVETSMDPPTGGRYCIYIYTYTHIYRYISTLKIELK